jgi:hypothetical protein
MCYPCRSGGLIEPDIGENAGTCQWIHLSSAGELLVLVWAGSCPRWSGRVGEQLVIRSSP